MNTSALAKAGSLEHVLYRLHELERRVSRLESPDESHHPDSRTAEPARSDSVQPALPATPLHAAGIGSIFGSVAKAVLGLAGAYLLRAGSEAGWLPHTAGVLTGFAYSLAWIVVAGRLKRRGHATSTIFTVTSSTIFLGLVWENAVRSPLLQPRIAALLIVVYLATGYLVAWLHDRCEIAAVTVASTTALSLVLFVTTHHLIPFNISLLCIAAASEFAACRGRWSGQRWMAALVADFAIFTTAWIFSESATLPEGYVPFGHASVFAVQLALVLVYLVSTGYRTLCAQRTITVFEIGQNIVGIGLFILGQFVVAPGSSSQFLGAVIWVVLALGSCAVAIGFGRKGAPRNSWAFSAFALAFLIAATPVLFPPNTRVFAWYVLGVGAAWLGKHEKQMNLQLQAPVYLFGAAFGCGLIQISGQSLTNLIVPDADHLTAMLISTAAIALAYTLFGSGSAPKERIPAFSCTALLVWSIVGLGAIAIKAVFGHLPIATSLRVGLICMAAIGSASWGMLSRSYADRPECVWISFPLMLYGAFWIVVDDLAGGRPAAASLSLLLYGGALWLLTRILRQRNRPAASQ